MSKYLVLQGAVSLAVVTNGVPGAFLDLLDVSSLDFGFKSEKGSHKEHRSGKRLEDFAWTKSTEGTIDMNIDDLNAKNLAVLFQGVATDAVSGSVTGEVIATTLPAVGDILRFSRGNVSAVVLKDSTGTAKTLVSGTNYTPDNDFGEVVIKDITTGGVFVAPLKVDFSYGAQTNVTMMTATAQEYWVRYKGLNADGKKVLVEFYRWRPDPGDKLSLINDDVAPSKMSGSVLADTTKAADAVLGQFGRIVYL